MINEPDKVFVACDRRSRVGAARRNDAAERTQGRSREWFADCWHHAGGRVRRASTQRTRTEESRQVGPTSRARLLSPDSSKQWFFRVVSESVDNLIRRCLDADVFERSRDRDAVDRDCGRGRRQPHSSLLGRWRLWTLSASRRCRQIESRPVRLQKRYFYVCAVFLVEHSLWNVVLRFYWRLSGCLSCCCRLRRVKARRS